MKIETEHIAISKRGTLRTLTMRYRFGFNGKENDNEVKGTGNQLDFGARIYDPRLGRWLSVDPFQEKYSSWSPYNYTLGNPILFVDPDGKQVFVHGLDASKTVKAMNSHSSLRLKFNSKTGELTAKGKAKTDYDKTLLAAINDKDVAVILYTTKANAFVAKDGTKTAILVGGYLGSETYNYSIDYHVSPGPDKMDYGYTETYNGQYTIAEQIFNYDQSAILQNEGFSTIGTDGIHEINEAYYGALEDAGGNYESGWLSAHKKSLMDDPGAKDLGIYDPNKGFKPIGVVDKKTKEAVILIQKSEKTIMFNKNESKKSTK